MATRKLRKEKDCLNCGTLVEDRFCPHCGQENREIRPSFRRLFTQFFIDFVNYDDGFLRTIKMILLKPGATVSEFLEGKRQRNFPPAKMVIFGCSQNDNPKEQVENYDKDIDLSTQNIDTNEIINLISLYEHIKREQNREIYSSEKLRQLKDSINFDSIMNNRDLPVFKKTD